MLDSGKPYSIKDIFKDENKIVIPDMQREYCWAKTLSQIENRPLVEIFINDLIANKKNEDTQMGLLYAYENPKDDYQLCDGQQRITTLYLLIGMLYRKLKRDDLKEILISHYELEQDDKEPRLQYAIRESTLFFLRDLVYYYFLGNNEQEISSCEVLKDQFWYFSEYDLDPSIQNILEALKIIESKLKGSDQHVEITDYIINHVQFLYFDMKDRIHGEQQFVVINTTGKPLSVTENLKPRMLGNLDDVDKLPELDNKTELEYYSDIWEEWEQFFWENKWNGNQVSDVGFKEFLRWITIINLLKKNKQDEAQNVLQKGKFEFDTSISLDEIDSYFKSVKWLFEDFFKIYEIKAKKLKYDEDFLNILSPREIKTDFDDYKKIISQKDCFKLLPLIEYVKNFGYSNTKNIDRIKNFFFNLTRIENISKSARLFIPDALAIVNLMSVNEIADVAFITTLGEIPKNNLLSREEVKEKFYLYTSGLYERDILEQTLWRAEENRILSGEIKPLLKWSKSDGAFNLESFNVYYETFEKLFDNNNDLDLTRRVFLLLGSEKYPRTFPGSSKTSFCHEYEHWKIVIFDNIEIIGLFFKKMIESGKTIKEFQETIIEEYSDISNKWYDFIKNPKLLGYCEQKYIQNSNRGWNLIKQKNATSYVNINTYLVHLELETKVWKNWELGLYETDLSCSYFNFVCNNSIFTIDLIFVNDDKFRINLFVKKGSLKTFDFFLSLKDLLSLKFNGKKYESESIARCDIMEYILKVMSEVEGLTPKSEIPSNIN